jgi:hypothetical protein
MSHSIHGALCAVDKTTKDKLWPLVGGRRKYDSLIQMQIDRGNGMASTNLVSIGAAIQIRSQSEGEEGWNTIAVLYANRRFLFVR